MIFKIISLGEKVIAIAKLMLSKGLPLCVYRFPGQGELRLAVLSELLDQKTETSFWIAPFTPHSASKEIVLSVVDEAFLNTFVERLQSIPDKHVQFSDLPEATRHETYLKQFEAIQGSISNDTIQKAILSRVIIEDKPDDFEPIDFFGRLCTDYPDAFVHLLYFPEAGMWLGATPELLVKKETRNLHIMAVAGTQPVNTDGRYHWRAKEQEEHAMVGRHIEAVCDKYQCEVVNKKGPFEVTAGRVAHLRTDYAFRESTPIPLKDFLHSLHPTPAIGGLPVDKSVEVICETEMYDRSYYCGFLGETDFAAYAKFYVNLRCMHVGKEHIAVFVGGGITKDSNVDEEWEETVMKSKTMIDKLKTLQRVL